MTRRSSFLLGAAALGAGGALAFLRLAPMAPEDWHVDPEAAERTGRPNDYLIAPGGDREPVVTAMAPGEVLARLDVAATVEPGVERLAGAPEEGLVTYVQRSRLMGYPDAISLRAVPEGDGARLTAWSRSRFGHSDLGVNRARVERWLSAAGIE